MDEWVKGVIEWVKEIQFRQGQNEVRQEGFNDYELFNKRAACRHGLGIGIIFETARFARAGALKILGMRYQEIFRSINQDTTVLLKLKAFPVPLRWYKNPNALSHGELSQKAS